MELDINNICYLPDATKSDHSPNDTLHLDELKDNQEGILVKIETGERELTRLCHLGLTPGTRIRKLQSAPFNGPIKIFVRDTILALGRGIAKHILLARESDPM